MFKAVGRIKTGVFLLTVAFVLCGTLVSSARAEHTPQVEIAAGEPRYGEKGFAVDVTVTFYDTSLYNDHVLLSYHILSADGAESLVFENPRLPLSVDANGVARQTVSVDRVSQPLLEPIDSAAIRLDMVDEANVFWFFDNPNVDLKTAELPYDATLLVSETAGETRAQAAPEGKQSLPIVFCILGWIGALSLLMGAKKAGLLPGRAEQLPYSTDGNGRAERG